MLSLIPLPVLPLLTTAIGLGGFTVGIISFLNPDAASWIYGCSSSVSRSKLSLSKELHYLHALSIRNFVTGATVLCITAYWQLGLNNTGPSGDSVQASEETKLVVQRVLGIVILLGSTVPLCDAAVCWGWFDGDRGGIGGSSGGREGVHGGAKAKVEQIQNQEVVEESTVRGKGEREAVEVTVQEVNSKDEDKEDDGKWAAMVHATRSVFWLIGGLWCLFG